MLAKQLATTKSDLAKHRASASKLSTKLETEQLLRTDAEQAAEQLKQRLEKLLEGSKEASKQRTELTQVCWEGRSCPKQLLHAWHFLLQTLYMLKVMSYGHQSCCCLHCSVVAATGDIQV